MMQIPTRWKRISQSISVAARMAKLGWKLSGGRVEIVDSFGAYIHHIELTQDERTFLANGGKIVLVHGCGTEVHIKLP